MTIETAPDVTALTARTDAVVDARRDDLLALSHDLHAHPELAFAETYSAARVAEVLAAAGFVVEPGAYGVPTAFEAVYGSGDLRLVLCAEYDALPGLGHACGHNVIATITTGAALALRTVADEIGITVVVLGTPAEEHGGGKVKLLRAGAFERATMSAMVHPAAGTFDISAADAVTQAVDRFDVTFTGRAAHAAAAPEHAINAASAATVAEVAIGLLRQHIPDGVRLAAVTTASGTVTNIVPGEARMSLEVRSRDIDEMLSVKRRLLACVEGAAIATGCTWEQHRAEPRYLPLVQDPTLATAWDQAIVRRERVFGPPHGSGGSTDMGNVSQVVPSIHPMLAIHGAGGPPHTIEFAAAAASPEGDACALVGAAALAATVVAVACNDDARADLLRRAAERAPGATTLDQDAD